MSSFPLVAVCVIKRKLLAHEPAWLTFAADGGAAKQPSFLQPSPSREAPSLSKSSCCSLRDAAGACSLPGTCSKRVGTAGPSKLPQCFLSPGSRGVGLCWSNQREQLLLCAGSRSRHGEVRTQCVFWQWMRGQGRWELPYSPSPSPSSSASIGRPCTSIRCLWLQPELGISLGFWLARAEGGDLSRSPAAAPGWAPTHSGAALSEGLSPLLRRPSSALQFLYRSCTSSWAEMALQEEINEFHLF